MEVLNEGFYSNQKNFESTDPFLNNTKEWNPRKVKSPEVNSKRLQINHLFRISIKTLIFKL